MFHISEKAVVYNFMDSLSKSTSNPIPARPTAPKPEEKRPAKPQFSKELYFQQRAKSARSQRVTERPSLPPRPKSVGSMRWISLLLKTEKQSLGYTEQTGLVFERQKAWIFGVAKWTKRDSSQGLGFDDSYLPLCEFHEKQGSLRYSAWLKHIIKETILSFPWAHELPVFRTLSYCPCAFVSLFVPQLSGFQWEAFTYVTIYVQSI